MAIWSRCARKPAHDAHFELCRFCPKWPLVSKICRRAPWRLSDEHIWRRKAEREVRCATRTQIMHVSSALAM